MRRCILCCILFFIPGIIFDNVHGTVDAFHYHLTEKMALDVRWENVKDPEFIYGTMPAWSLDTGLHTFRLEPGQKTYIRLPAHEQMQFLWLDKNREVSDFTVSISYGSRLFCHLPLQKSIDNQRLLLIPNLDFPSLVCIQNTSTKRKINAVAAFISRSETMPNFAPYRKNVDIHAPQIELYENYQKQKSTFYKMRPQLPIFIKTQSPGRFQIKIRYCYEKQTRQDNQTFRIWSHFDHQPKQLNIFETKPETLNPVFFNGTFQLTGRVETFYVELPKGNHTLVLRSDSNLLIRVVKQERPDYLFKSRNAPERYTLDYRDQKSYAAIDKLPTKGNPFKTASTIPVLQLEPYAISLCRNNTIQSAGLTAAMLMENAFDLYNKYPELRRQANKIYDHHTFYRNVLPSIKQSRSYQKHLTFFSKQIADKENGKNPLFVFDQLMQNKINKLPTAFFNRISKGQKIQYQVPDHATPGFLRIIVPAPFQQNSFFVKPGEKAPFLFTTRAASHIPDLDDQLKAEELYMGLMNISKNKPVKIYGDILDMPGNCVMAEVFELYLPANVKTIMVWLEKSLSNDMDIALQYRASKKFKWSANEYLKMKPFIRMDQVRNNLLHSLSIFVHRKEKLYPEEKELIQTLNPLYRFLHSRSNRFATSVSSKFKQNNSANNPLKNAKKIFQQIKLFQTSHDDYAAHELLKALLVYHPETSIQITAFEKLKGIYEKKQNNQSLISLFAYAASKNLFSGLLPQMLPLLLAEGYTEFAHLLSLILETTPESIPSILTALFDQNQDEIIFEVMDNLSDIKEKNFWHMQMQLKNGHYQVAQELLFNHHPEDYPKNYFEHIQQGFRIKDQLLALDQTTRLNGILEWEQWQLSHPGPECWKNANAHVVDYDGARTIYSPDLDLYGQVYVATEKKPMTIQIMGPAELRLEIRPVHSMDQSTLLNGWVLLQINDEIEMVPVYRNTKTSNIEIVGHPNEHPGNKVIKIFKIQGGLHQIRISPTPFQIYASVDIRRPQIHHSVLPFMTPEKVAQIVNPDGSNNQNVSYKRTIGSMIHIIDTNKQSFQTIASHLVPKISCLTPNHIQQKLEHINRILDQKRAKPISNSNLAFKIDHQGKIGLHSIFSTPYNKMLLLAYNAEKENMLSRQTIFEAEQLFYLNQKNNDPGFKSLFNRFMKRTEWEKIDSILSSAGIRYIEFKGFHPESPFLRKRKALIPVLKPHDHILSGDNGLILSSYLLTSKAMTINLALVDIGFNDILPLEVSCQIDDEPAIIKLTQSNETYPIERSIGPGHHTIQFKILQPIENQLLKISVAFSKNHQKENPQQQDYLIKEVKRIYHIASLAEPIEFEIEGPAWLRIDEWRSGKTISRYQAVNDGFQTIRLFPVDGLDEGLFRVFYKTNKKSRVTPTARIQMTYSQTPIKSFFQLPTRAVHQSIVFRDQSLLDFQANSTISMTGKWVGRKNINEDDVSLDQKDQFMEMGSHYRFYDESVRTYYHAQFFTRQKDNGSALLGVKGQLLRLPEELPFNLRLNGSFYMQQPENQNIEWRAKVNGRISKRFYFTPKISHLSYLSGFAQLLSMKGTHQHDLAYIDQDIFTPYKLDHQLGVSIGDQLTFQPFLDTQLKMGLSLTTNEDSRIFVPDHIQFNTGWIQYLNPLTAEFQYGLKWYLSDLNRDNNLTRNIFKTIFTWEKWRINTHRLEAQVEISHKIESGQTSGQILFHYHLGKGRYYKDFPIFSKMKALKKSQVLRNK